MNKKFKHIKRLAYFYTLLTLIILGVFIVGSYYFPILDELIHDELFVTSFLCVFVLLNGFLCVYFCSFYEKETRRIHTSITQTLGVDIGEAYVFGGIGIISYSKNYEIIWISELFESLQTKLLGKNILNVFEELKQIFDNKNAENHTKITLENKQYEVMVLKEINVLILKDITQVEKLFKEKQQDAPVIITISLDNLLDMANVLQDEFIIIEQTIRNKIAEWAKKHNILIKKIKDDAYLALLTESIYEELKQNDFDIVKQIDELKIQNKKGINLTISLGVGRGNNDFLKISELSANAIELAHSRGGNQVVEYNYGSHAKIYGESSEQDTRHNILRIKTSAQQFGSMISNFHKFLCVPHQNADFDAIGACLGICSMAKQLNAEAYVVCEKEQMESKTRELTRRTFSKEELDELFISSTEARELLDDNTLVVVADVHRKDMTTCPNVIMYAKNIAVIDHHRRSADSIDDPSFTLIDPDSSSTCEIIALFAKLQSMRVSIEPRIATYMLTGILLDTNNLKARTTFNTYDAINALKEYGADNVEAGNNLKDEFEEYKLKTKIMTTTECPLTGLYVATVPEDIITTETMIAKVAQEAFNVKGVKAMFVVGKVSRGGKPFIKISARSDGTINVQYILEHLNGGGHYSSAAASFMKNETVLEVKTQLLNMLDLLKNEIRSEN